MKIKKRVIIAIILTIFVLFLNHYPTKAFQDFLTVSMHSLFGFTAL